MQPPAQGKESADAPDADRGSAAPPEPVASAPIFAPIPASQAGPQTTNPGCSGPEALDAPREPPGRRNLVPPAALRDSAGQVWRSIGILALVLLIGTALRVPLAFQAGYGADVSWFANWTRVVTLHGFRDLYATTDCNYPPLYVLIMRGAGEAWQSWIEPRLGNDPQRGPPYAPKLADSAYYRAYVRVPACLADILLAIVLWIETRRLFSARAAAVAATAYFLNPAAMYVSGYWGQVDSVHTLLLTAALVACNRHARLTCGFFVGLSLLQKLQSIAVVPLFFLEFYRYQRWRGVGGVLLGAVLAAIVVLSPFVFTGSFDLALKRGYGQAVGYYEDRSLYAFNLWTLLDQQDASDRDVPGWLLRMQAGPEQISVPAKGQWYSHVTYRTLSLALFALAVAVILSLHSRAHRHDLRSLAAGMLALAFFLFPTEMHERYAFPVLGLMVFWAMATPGRMTLYWLFSALFVLNLAAVQKPDAINRVISIGLLALFAALLWCLLAKRRAATAAAEPVALDSESLNDGAPLPSKLVRAFQVVTLLGCVGAALGGFFVWERQRHVPAARSSDAMVFLSDLKPIVASNGWRELAQDQSVSRSVLQCDGAYYLRGLGMHAPARAVYEVPEGFDRLVTKVCVDPRHKGRVSARVRLDGRAVWQQRLEHGDSADVDVPLGHTKFLMLEITPEGDQKSDHVNWCGARLIRQAASQPSSES